MWVYVIIGVLVGLLIGLLIVRRRRDGPEPSQADGLAALEQVNRQRTAEKGEHLKVILKMTSTDGRVTNNQVEKKLGVSDSTATRYLNELESQGRLAQQGEGRSVYYTLIGSIDD